MEYTSHSSFSGLAALISAAAMMTGNAFAANDWTNWRGPLQTGVSLEHYTDGGKLVEKPVWTFPSRSRGCPVVCDGKVFSFGYYGEKEELVECLTCLDERTGEKQWEVKIKDFISDTVYNRYAIGSPTVDPDTKKVYLLTAYGVFGCWDFNGKELWRHSLMEELGRLTFPNSKVGSPVIEGDLVIVRGITANWGADGPAADRFYAYDKNTGELVWACTPGEIPPTDSSFSTPILETRDGKRVFYAATGCGNLVAVNARNGKPLWRYKMSKVGVNATPVLHGGNKIICIHGDENVDTADKGRMIAVKLPEKFGAEPIVHDPAVDKADWSANEVWRNSQGAGSSSPIIVGDVVYQINDTGAVVAVNANDGSIVWTAKVSNGNTHASLCYVDGLLIAPLMEGKVFVLNAKDGKVLQAIELKGNCIGAAMVCNGQAYVHTTEELYCFKLQHSGINTDAAPAADLPKPGAAVALQIVPAEFVISPGQKVGFRIYSIDGNGLRVNEAATAQWETFIPPTAKVKAKIDDAVFEGNTLIANGDAKNGAGAFKATVDGIFGTVRGRVLMKPPFKADFNTIELKEDQPQEGVKFAYPPLPWIGARFKFDVREVESEKVLSKTFDRLIFQRATVFIGTSDMHDYTVQADVMTDGNRRVKSDVGIINQRYAIVLKGNANVLEISSNFERLTRTTPLKIEPNHWYTVKSTVKVNDDGSGVVFAKAWDRGQPEPEAWTLEAKVPMVHKQGSPGLFGFTPQNQKRVYIDNISVTPNK